MSTLEVKVLALQLSHAVDGLEKRIDHASRQSLQATQALDLQAKQSLDTMHKLVQQGIEQFRLGARQAIAEGVRGAMQDIDQTLHEGATRIDRAVSQLDLRMQHVGRFNVSHAWKSLVASALGSLAVIAVVKLSLAIAGAVWTMDMLNKFLPLGQQGLSHASIEQGGIGLILTMLIITVPPMAANFFQGTLGNFMHYSAFGGSGVNQWKAANGMSSSPPAPPTATPQTGTIAKP